MTGSADDLDAECRLFTRYLCDREPDEYVLANYRSAHAHLALAPDPGGLDAALLRAARGGPRRLRLADAHARLVHPRSVLRKKLVLLLAILECHAPFAGAISGPPDAARLGSWLGLVARGASAALRVGVGAGWAALERRRARGGG